MRRVRWIPLWLLWFVFLPQLLLVHLSFERAFAAASFIELEPAAGWEMNSVWRVRHVENDFISLADLAEGRERYVLWSGIQQITFRPDRSTDFTLTAVRTGAAGRAETRYLTTTPAKRTDAFHDARWRSIDLSAGRKWVATSGASWRLGLDITLCELPGRCAPAIAGGQWSIARASDPLVWRAALSLGRSFVTLSGSVDVVISPTLALGTSLSVSRLPGLGETAAWWAETLTFQLGKSRYISIELGLDLFTHEPSLTVGVQLPLGPG